MSANCSSCGAAIIWVQTEAGKRTCLNAHPEPMGNIVVKDGVPPTSWVATKTRPAPPGTPLYLDHHATCPQGRSWRTRK